MFSYCDYCNPDWVRKFDNLRCDKYITKIEGNMFYIFEVPKKQKLFQPRVKPQLVFACCMCKIHEVTLLDILYMYDFEYEHKTLFHTSEWTKMRNMNYECLKNDIDGAPWKNKFDQLHHAAYKTNITGYRLYITCEAYYGAGQNIIRPSFLAELNLNHIHETTVIEILLSYNFGASYSYLYDMESYKSLCAK